jgi:hypothetical protein
MFKRIDEFGGLYPNLFAEGTRAGKALQVIHAVVKQLGSELVTKLKTDKGGQYTRVQARELLQKRLEAVARLAQAIGETKPGFKETFQCPADTSDDGLITAGRLFAHEIEVHMQDFGVPDAHLGGFTELTDALEQAVKARTLGRAGQTTARAAMAEALDEGMAAVRELDAVMPLLLVDDPVTMSAWQQARRIDQSRRGRKAARPTEAPPASAPDAVAPASVDAVLKVAS